MKRIADDRTRALHEARTRDARRKNHGKPDARYWLLDQISTFPAEV